MATEVDRTKAQRVAAALRDVADMVEKLGLGDIAVKAYTDFRGEPRVGLEPMASKGELTDPDGTRRALDGIAEHIGSELRAQHSRGELWAIRSIYDRGRLPSGARAYVHRRIKGRPLDLAPLPARRNRGGAR